MENSEIISELIVAITSIITAIIAFLVGRYNSKTNKQINVLEEQYKKVVSPIHYVLIRKKQIRDTK